MTMTPCTRCAGLIPESCRACPNCDEEPARAHKLAGAVAVGAAAMTLMACYGAGDYGGYEAQWPTTTPEACNLATELPSDAGEAYASDRSDGYRASDALESPCASSSGPERTFHYDPGEAAGVAGKVTVLWDSPSEHSVFLLQSCGDVAALACGEPAFNGQLELEVEALAAFDIVVDSVGQFDGDAFELEVVFEPTP